MSPEISTGELIGRIIELRIRPVLQTHGGDIAFVSFDEEKKVVHVVLQGACNGCPNALNTLKETVEGFLKMCVSDDVVVQDDTL